MVANRFTNHHRLRQSNFQVNSLCAKGGRFLTFEHFAGQCSCSRVPGKAPSCPSFPSIESSPPSLQSPPHLLHLIGAPACRAKAERRRKLSRRRLSSCQKSLLCKTSESFLFARILLRMPAGFLPQSRQGAKAQRAFSGLASWRLGDFAMKGLFYPWNPRNLSSVLSSEGQAKEEGRANAKSSLFQIHYSKLPLPTADMRAIPERATPKSTQTAFLAFISIL
jgi:hypothetical protein